jgi:hypothetical protein
MIGGRNEETIDSMPLSSFSNVITPSYDARQKEILDSIKMKLNSIKPAFRIHAFVAGKIGPLLLINSVLNSS